jgi:hypothetical protein
VVFKRDGARAVFVKAGLATRRMLHVRVPDSLQEFFTLTAGEPVPTRFRLRVLARKFGRRFTSDANSPIVSAPRPPQTVVPVEGLPDGDCDGDGAKNRDDADDDNDGLTDAVELSLSLDPCLADTDKDGILDKWEFDCDRNGVLNRDQADDDSDLLSDATETAISTDPCNADSDGDSIEDGYEFQSAKDLNDDEYQEPNQNLPYPGKRPYPNPLFADAGIDYDGDSLTLAEEQSLWRYTYAINASATRTLDTLSYSDGNKHSIYRRVDGRRTPALPVAGYDRQDEFLGWASANGYMTVFIPHNGFHDIRDVNLSGGVEPRESAYADYDGNDFLADDERDEDADGLTNYDETHGRSKSGYWSTCYSMEAPHKLEYAGTEVDDADSDGDGVRDGADDQDHDDVPNLMELSRKDASGLDDTDPGKPCKVAEDLVLGDLDGDGVVDYEGANHPTAYGRVNPFNPCLPFTDSRTCVSHPALSGAAAPYDDSPNWLSLQ